jgi:kumamolisin
MNNRKVFHDSVTELPEQPGVPPTGLNVSAARPAFLQEKMNVSFSLAISQQAHDPFMVAGEVRPEHQKFLWLASASNRDRCNKRGTGA